MANNIIFMISAGSLYIQQKVKALVYHSKKVLTGINICINVSVTLLYVSMSV